MKHLKAWKIRNNFKLHEAALLMLGYDIDKHGANIEALLNNPPDGFKALYGRILSDACYFHEYQQSEVSPDIYIAIYELQTNKPGNIEELTEVEGTKISANSSDIAAWINRHSNRDNPLPDKFFTVELSGVECVEDLTTKERHTLLIIIAALAKEAGLDVSRTSKAADLISNMTQLIGCRVSPSTIENHLKLIPDAKESRAK